jgi:hypothetical protein
MYFFIVVLGIKKNFIYLFLRCSVSVLPVVVKNLRFWIFLRQDLAMWPRLAWTLHSLASASHMLGNFEGGLGFCGTGDQNPDLMYAMQTLNH